MIKAIRVYWNWKRKCGYCGHTCSVATDGRNLFCHCCGRW